jgi:hypothetical protein
MVNVVACRTVAMQRPRDGQIYRAVSGQLVGKHFPAATDTNATVAQQ